MINRKEQKIKDMKKEIEEDRAINDMAFIEKRLDWLINDYVAFELELEEKNVEIEILKLRSNK